jgi:hypothetical protein
MTSCMHADRARFVLDYTHVKVTYHAASIHILGHEYQINRSAVSKVKPGYCDAKISIQGQDSDWSGSSVPGTILSMVSKHGAPMIPRWNSRLFPHKSKYMEPWPSVLNSIASSLPTVNNQSCRPPNKQDLVVPSPSRKPQKT